jgi:hypothetical protein
MSANQPSQPTNAAGHYAWVAILRLCVVGGSMLTVAGGLAVALTLIPEAVHDTTARVWIGVGLFGLATASLAGIAIYALGSLPPRTGLEQDSDHSTTGPSQSGEGPEAVEPEQIPALAGG